MARVVQHVEPWRTLRSSGACLVAGRADWTHSTNLIAAVPQLVTDLYSLAKFSSSMCDIYDEMCTIT